MEIAELVKSVGGNGILSSITDIERVIESLDNLTRVMGIWSEAITNEKDEIANSVAHFDRRTTKGVHSGLDKIVKAFTYMQNANA